MVSIIERTRDNEYPKLMINSASDIIVLFITSEIGTVVYDVSGDDEVGQTFDTWCIDDFTLFNGKVILSN